MKKLFLIVLSAVLLSCDKEPIVEPQPEIPSGKQPPCMILQRVSGGGYIKAQILIIEPFDGVIYVKNPTIGNVVKRYKPRLIDTSIVNPNITMNSRIVVSYGWGQMEK